jgi:uncharacterized SAM-binding protein YcdF (DUF218 family)
MPLLFYMKKTRLMINGIIVLFTLWVSGLLWFVHLVPETVTDPVTKTDAIVVLTGGSNRLMTGIDLLEKGQANKLLISGVGEHATIGHLKSLSKEVDAVQVQPLESRIVVGHLATNTNSNAVETAIWMEFERYRSMRLVTANYHIPRSILQFQDAMPGTIIIPHPVFPENFHLHQWWRSPGTARLLISEYSKYIALKCLLLTGIRYKG